MFSEVIFDGSFGETLVAAQPLVQPVGRLKKKTLIQMSKLVRKLHLNIDIYVGWQNVLTTQEWNRTSNRP